MKKFFLLFLFLIILFITVAHAEINNSSIRYTLNFNSNTKGILSYQVYKKADKLKIIMPNAIFFVNNLTGEAITYLPQQKMALKQNNNIAEKIPILDEKATDIANSKFKKAGTKNINGYICTLYSDAISGVDVCYSEEYKTAVYMKTPANTLTLTNISTSPISDMEFDLPAGVTIQSIPTMPFSYPNR